MDKKRILVIEDSEVDVLILSHTLGIKYNLEFASSAEVAMGILTRDKFDLILLDITLPGLHGLDFLRRIKQVPAYEFTPVIFVSGRHSVEDKVEGLRAGAEDFIAKPFASAELMARIETCLRRTGTVRADNESLKCGPLTLDYQKHSLILTHESQSISRGLTSTEIKLLSYFFNRPNVICTRSQIISDVWGTDVHVLERTVDARVNSIRKKMGPLSNLLNAVHGIGYKLAVEPNKSKAS